MVLLWSQRVSFLVSMHHEIGDLLTGLGHVMSCVFEFVHRCRAGADIRLHVWINIPSLDGGGTDLLRLQSTAKDGHRTGGEDVAVKAVDVYSGIAELRISVDANMGFLSISSECDLFLIPVFKREEARISCKCSSKLMSDLLTSAIIGRSVIYKM